MDESLVDVDIEISRAMQLIDTTAEWELRELQTFTSTLIGQSHVSAESNPFRPLIYATALWQAACAVVTAQVQRATLLRLSAGVAAGLLKNAWAAACTRSRRRASSPAPIAPWCCAGGGSGPAADAPRASTSPGPARSAGCSRGCRAGRPAKRRLADGEPAAAGAAPAARRAARHRAPRAARAPLRKAPSSRRRCCGSTSCCASCRAETRRRRSRWNRRAARPSPLGPGRERRRSRRPPGDRAAVAHLRDRSSPIRCCRPPSARSSRACRSPRCASRCRSRR